MPYFDIKTVVYTVLAIVFLVVFHIGSAEYGKSTILGADRLEAQSEVIYQIVTIPNDAPSDKLLLSASLVCANAGNKETCITKHLGQYGVTYLVNMIDGTRERLTTEGIDNER